MNASLRLVVAGMAGILVTAVAYRAHQWQEADDALRRRLPPMPTLIAAAPIPIREGQLDAIGRDLATRFPIEPRRGTDVNAGWSYTPGDRSLLEVRSEALRRFLPDTRFFRTTLLGPDVTLESLLVSFERKPEWDDIRTCAMSLDYPHQFLSQFIGVPAPTVQARRELAVAVAELLAFPGAGGRARVSAHAVGDEARAELWYGDLHGFDIVITSGSSGRVDRITMSN